jgi:hypothetical protein
MGLSYELGLLTLGQVLSCSLDYRVTDQQWSEIPLTSRKRQIAHESRNA